MKKRVKIEKFCGLEWVTITGVPCRDTKFGNAIASRTLQMIEVKVARYIVENRVPIRGAEVKYLRKTFGFTLDKLGTELGFSSTAIFKWEKARDRQLERVNEVAMRVWAAEKLGIDIPARFSGLFALESQPTAVNLKAA